MTNIWLKNWASRNSAVGDNGPLGYYLGIYAVLGVSASLVFLANGIILYSFCVIQSAKSMHDGMFHAVMRAPMSFFETTPLGVVRTIFSFLLPTFRFNLPMQILNRFSRDIQVVDETLARTFGGFFRTLAGVVGPSPSSRPSILAAILNVEVV